MKCCRCKRRNGRIGERVLKSVGCGEGDRRGKGPRLNHYRHRDRVNEANEHSYRQAVVILRRWKRWGETQECDTSDIDDVVWEPYT